MRDADNFVAVTRAFESRAADFNVARADLETSGTLIASAEYELDLLKRVIRDSLLQPQAPGRPEFADGAAEPLRSGPVQSAEVETAPAKPEVVAAESPNFDEPEKVARTHSPLAA
jgi:hypothetical protein